MEINMVGKDVRDISEQEVQHGKIIAEDMYGRLIMEFDDLPNEIFILEDKFKDSYVFEEPNKNWIDKMIKGMENIADEKMGDDVSLELKTHIEKYMPTITGEEMYDAGLLFSDRQKMKQLLKYKGLYKSLIPEQ